MDPNIIRTRLAATLVVAALTVLAIIAGSTPAQAAARCEWSGAVNSAWSLGRNWFFCNPDGPHNGDSLVFPNNAVRNVSTNDKPGLTIASLMFVGKPFTGQPWQINGNAFGLTLGAQTAATVDTLINVPIRLDSDSVLRNVGPSGTGSISGTLFLNSPIDLNGHHLTLDNSFDVTIRGPITGSGALTVAASTPHDALTSFLGDNSYAGSTDLSGIVTIATGRPFGDPAAGQVVLRDGAELRFLDGMTFPYALTQGSAKLTFPVNRQVVFANTLTSTVQGSGVNFNVPNGTEVLILGSIQALLLDKQGSGTLTFANPHGDADPWIGIVHESGTVKVAVSGSFPDTAVESMEIPDCTCSFNLGNVDETVGAIQGGGPHASIQLNGQTLTVNTKPNTFATFDGTIAGSGNLVKTGAGRLDLRGNNTYTGTTTVTAGVLGAFPLTTGPAIRGPVVIAAAGRFMLGPTNSTLPTTPIVINAAGTLDATASGNRSLGPISGDGTVVFGTNTITMGADGKSATFNGAITGTGDLVKAQFGSLTLGGPVSVRNMIVAAGQLLVNGTLTTTGTLTLTTGTLLGGLGTVGNVSGGSGLIGPGTVPGVSPGVLHAGTVALTGPLSLVVELNGPNPGVNGYSQLALTGDLNLTNSSLQASVGFQPPPGAAFTIVDLAPGRTVTGAFDGLPEGATLTLGRHQFIISYRGGPDHNDVVLTSTDRPPALTYFLTEGSTGSFFDEDVLIANPNRDTAPVTLTFTKETGEQVVETASISPQSRLTVHVDKIPGLESASPTTQVRSENGLPLVVERSMFWDASYYAGSTGSSVDKMSTDWFFADGAEGLFQTFLLVNNPNDAPTNVTFTYLLENGAPIQQIATIAAGTRLTLDAGSIPELANQSFGVTVRADQPIMAERSIYFGTTPSRLFGGGTESAGVTSPSTHWFLAEGATGKFFTTFILLSNAKSTPAHVTLQYLLGDGQTVSVKKTIPATARLTTNIATEDDVRLQNASVSTIVTSDIPIVAERSMYWPGATKPYGEGHNSFGVVDAGLKWGLSEGRSGGPLNYHTYLLVGNPQITAANVTVTFLREGGTPVVQTYTVPATSRLNIDTATIPDLKDTSFGAVVESTNNVPIVVERSMYWDSNGFTFSGGTNATGIALTP